MRRTSLVTLCFILAFVLSPSRAFGLTVSIPSQGSLGHLQPHMRVAAALIVNKRLLTI